MHVIFYTQTPGVQPVLASRAVGQVMSYPHIWLIVYWKMTDKCNPYCKSPHEMLNLAVMTVSRFMSTWWFFSDFFSCTIQ